MRRAAPLALALATLALVACGSAKVTPTAKAAPTTPVFAPYLPFTLDSDPKLTDALGATGAQLLNLAFVIGTGNSCRPAWDGSLPVAGRPFLNEVRAVRAAGADVQISFGGQGGTDLSTACSSAHALARAYHAALKAYGARKADFDIEGNALSNAAGRTRLVAAIKSLERDHGLRVVLTVPVDPANGLDPGAVSILRAAHRTRTRIDVVNVMTMDFGKDNAPPGQDTMAGYSIKAADRAADQAQAAYPRADGWWHHLGITPMLGLNDDTTETFTLDDAKALQAFASTQKVAEFGMWSAARDRACAGPITSPQERCSGVAQDPYAFSQIFRALDQ